MVGLNEPVLCPACGARNKPRWEYCVRCGESLAEAESASAPQRKASEESAERLSETPSSFFDGLLASVSFLLMIATAVAGASFACNAGPPPPPPPSGLTIPTQPPKPSPASAGAAVVPGQDAFQEGLRLLNTGSAEAALPLLSQAVSEDSGKALFQWTYGEALVKTGDAAGGLDAQREAARLDPVRYRMQYAKSLGVNTRRDEAVAEFEAILAESPGDPEALKGAGWYLCQGGDFARGLPLLRRAAEARPTDAALFASLGGMAAASGQRQEAADAYWQAVQLQPGNHEARHALASQLEKLGKGDDAVEVLRRGAASSPEAARLQRDLGLLLERLGRPGEAAAALRDYVRAAPEAADAEAMRQKAERLGSATAGS